MKKQFCLIIAALVLSVTACREDLLDTAPYNSLSSSNMWTSESMTELGVAGVYQALRLGIDGNNPSMLELYQFDRYSGGMTRDPDPFTAGTVTSANGTISNTWRNLYEGVHRANDAIYNIPIKSPAAEEKKAKFVAECKFLRAYFYYRLNQLWKGVPVYLEPVTVEQLDRPRATEQEVWDVILDDLTDAINEPNLPAKYAAKDANYGRITKAAAYALRGKVYMYLERWDDAIADFENVKTSGHALFTTGSNAYFQLFKQANEQSDEMIFSIQNIGQSGYGSSVTKFCGTRSTFGSDWNTFLVSPDVVDLYENADGSKFEWDLVLPGYSSMTPAQREVFFLRDGLTDAEKTAAATRGADMTQYLPVGNEARILAAYQNRDPRLAANVITPYSSYKGSMAGADVNTVSRWPFRNQNSPVFDLQTDTRNFFFYLHRKFVPEGTSETPDRAYGPIDYPVIRYADVLLLWAEALNENEELDAAIEKVNEVRARAGVGLLNSSVATTVIDQTDLQTRIRNERRREFLNEGVTFFDELRWKTWQSQVFYPGAGVKQVWGVNSLSYTWAGDHLYTWPIPVAERQKNPNLTPTPGWPD